ncbi:methionine adenosyltransferase 2 subunit beta-like isoform X2 [Lineus longissimus]
MAKSKVMITGASGLFGRAISREFSGHSNWDVLGLAFSRARDGMKKVDLTKPEEVQEVMQSYKPNVVVHAAAERRPDAVEKQEEAVKRLNVDATTTLCEEASKVGAWVLYISTDYVFDGESPPYQVDAETNPINKYGISKRNGEIAALDVSKENCVLRVPILYGQVETLNESAVTCLFPPVMDTSKPCKMNDFEKRYPASVDDLAVVIRQFAEQKMKVSSLNGIFHYSGTEQKTKYEMALAMAEIFNITTEHIIADKESVSGAKRPYDTRLDSSRLELLGIGQRTPFKEAIKKCLEPFYSTK